MSFGGLSLSVCKPLSETPLPPGSCSKYLPLASKQKGGYPLIKCAKCRSQATHDTLKSSHSLVTKLHEIAKPKSRHQWSTSQAGHLACQANLDICWWSCSALFSKADQKDDLRASTFLKEFDWWALPLKQRTCQRGHLWKSYLEDLQLACQHKFLRCLWLPPGILDEKVQWKRLQKWRQAYMSNHSLWHTRRGTSFAMSPLQMIKQI